MTVVTVVAGRAFLVYVRMKEMRMVNDLSPVVLLLFSGFRSEAGLRVSSVAVNGGKSCGRA